MTYGPGPTPPDGYHPGNQYGYPPEGGHPPIGYPPIASTGSYPQGPYGPAPIGGVAPGMPGLGAMQPVPAPGYGPYPGGPGYPPPTNNGLKIALICLVAVLVLGGAGVGTYLLLQKDDKPTAGSPVAPPPQVDKGKEDKQREPKEDHRPGGDQNPGLRNENQESPRPDADLGDDQATPAPDMTPDREAPTTGGSDGVLPTSSLFMALSRDVAPSSIGDYEVSFTPDSTSYRHKTNSSHYLVAWAKASNADIEQDMQFRKGVVNFGDIQCGEVVMMACFAPHPRHPDVWVRVSGLGESPQDISAFIKILLEKLP